MNLSPTLKLFGTAINYGFGDVEETGILIAVDEILEEKRVRHINTFIAEHPEALKITSGANKVIYQEKSMKTSRSCAKHFGTFFLKPPYTIGRLMSLIF